MLSSVYTLFKEMKLAALSIDEKYMLRCLEIASMGLGHTSPNPMVGSVVVYNNTIIGEGYHQKYGESHAEVNAINAVNNKELLKESTLYVNLEPCAHYGKTPPCADYIIKHQIPRVVIGAIDVNPAVCGKGLLRMEEAGIDVTVGVLEKDCWDLNRRFYVFQEHQRPYIILKWAQSFDLFIDSKRDDRIDAKPTWITDEIDRLLVHKWRGEEQAILVGSGTVLKDNPMLTTRDYPGNHPVRIILDRQGRIPSNSNIFSPDAFTRIYTNNPLKKGSNYVNCPDENIIPFMLKDLFEQQIQSIIIEGGAQILDTFIKEGLWDEARVFTGKTLFGAGVNAPRISGNLIYQLPLHSSLLHIYRNPNWIAE